MKCIKEMQEPVVELHLTNARPLHAEYTDAVNNGNKFPRIKRYTFKLYRTLPTKY